MYSPITGYMIRCRVISKLGISRQYSGAMAGHLNFRNYLNISFGGIFYHLERLLLGIKATTLFAVVNKGFIVAVIANDGRIAPCAYSRKFRVFLYFQTPALVIG